MIIEVQGRRGRARDPESSLESGSAIGSCVSAGSKTGQPEAKTGQQKAQASG